MEVLRSLIQVGALKFIPSKHLVLIFMIAYYINQDSPKKQNQRDIYRYIRGDVL